MDALDLYWTFLILCLILRCMRSDHGVRRANLFIFGFLATELCSGLLLGAVHWLANRVGHCMAGLLLILGLTFCLVGVRTIVMAIFTPDYLLCWRGLRSLVRSLLGIDPNPR